jgi:hypothetical protein
VHLFCSPTDFLDRSSQILANCNSHDVDNVAISNSITNSITMPRVSQRAEAIISLSLLFNNRIKLKAIRLLNDDEDSLEDVKDLATAICLSKIRKSRYLNRSNKYRKSPAVGRFETDLNLDDGESNASSDTESDLPWLSDDEFLQKYRVTRKSFYAILSLIKDHDVFSSKRRLMAPPQYQLMVFLKFVGTEGAGANNSNQRSTFGVGYGTAALYRSWCFSNSLVLKEPVLIIPTKGVLLVWATVQLLSTGRE